MFRMILQNSLLQTSVLMKNNKKSVTLRDGFFIMFRFPVILFSWNEFVICVGIGLNDHTVDFQIGTIPQYYICKSLQSPRRSCSDLEKTYL